MRKILIFLGTVFAGMIAFLVLMGILVKFAMSGGAMPDTVEQNSILHLKIDGVIMNGHKFLNPLIKYRENPDIKAIVIEVSSPGGVVGPSQEMYMEIKKTREQFKKPIVVVSTSLIASGAYYAAAAADKIYVAPGTLIGSIGVIMEFVNLEKLYDWAKVSRFTITTGKYKDSGAEYRTMREDERELFQSMINDVWVQFKEAIEEGRGLKKDLVEQYSDGRVMTGRQAVELGFADGFATVDEAFDKAAEMAFLGKDYEIFTPPKERKNFLDLIPAEEEDPYTKAAQKFLQLELANKPLYLMPGYF
ncbi:MAG: signal peptide peptidase SppA [Pseudobdellovibrionaceae bacterium]